MHISRIMKKPILILIGILVLTSTFGCEPGGRPIIENQLNIELNIKVFRIRSGPSAGLIYDGIVPARNEKELSGIAFPGTGSEWMVRIEAKDTSGITIFSHDYNRDDLEKIDWKITISP